MKIIALPLALITGSTLAQSFDPADELRADAAMRTSSLAEAGAGWEKGNFFITDGGANTLKVYGFTQFRYLANFRDEDSAGEQGDFTHGFQMRRTRIGMKGSIWDKNLTFDIVGEFSRSTGVFTLVDGFAQYKFDNGMNIRWGQFKVPFMREELISDVRQLTVERSTFNTVFSQMRSQGIQLGYEGEKFRGWAEVSDGGNAINTDFTSGSEADFGLTARGEFRWGDGDFKRFEDFTSWRGSKYAGLVGAAVHYHDGGETGGTTDTAVFSATADVSIEGDGWNLFAAGTWRNTDPAGGASTDDFGVVVQGGFFFSDQCEAFARYDAIFPDDANGDDFHTLTAGVNYYVSPQSHAVKISADVQYYFNDEGANALVSPTTGSNLLADTEDGQVALRVQAQVMF